MRPSRHSFGWNACQLERRSPCERRTNHAAAATTTTTTTVSLDFTLPRETSRALRATIVSFSLPSKIRPDASRLFPSSACIDRAIVFVFVLDLNLSRDSTRRLRDTFDEILFDSILAQPDPLSPSLENLRLRANRSFSNYRCHDPRAHPPSCTDGELSLGMQIALFPYVRVMGYYAHVATTKEFDDSSYPVTVVGDSLRRVGSRISRSDHRRGFN